MISALKLITSKFKWSVLLGCAVLAAGAAKAQDSGPLIDLLLKKGIVTDQEAEDLRSELVKDFSANTSAGKLNLSSDINSLTIGGDVRVRYEYRQGQTPAGDNNERGRFRYRVRPYITGVAGDWFFGFRLENSTNSRSSNVTMGDDAGPFSKTNDGVYIGQVYVGYRPNSDWTLIAGRMPNPFVTTLLTWDADINPEGLAQQFKHSDGNLTYFANMGQFLYDSANPQNAIAPAINRQDQYLLGWQGGVTVKVNETSTIQVAPTLYNYVNNNATSKTFAGAFNPANQTAINNLMVIDVPVEFATTLPTGTPARVFGDFAYNADGKARAQKFGRPDLDDQVSAWQIGAQYGKAKLKGEWDAQVYYQQTDLFALDPNLVDSDIFDSRVNVQGFVVGANYKLTNAVTLSATYGNGKTHEMSAISAGAGDISAATLKNYSLVQFDVVTKF